MFNRSYYNKELYNNSTVWVEATNDRLVPSPLPWTELSHARSVGKNHHKSFKSIYFKNIGNKVM